MVVLYHNLLDCDLKPQTNSLRYIYPRGGLLVVGNAELRSLRKCSLQIEGLLCYFTQKIAVECPSV